MHLFKDRSPPTEDVGSGVAGEQFTMGKAFSHYKDTPKYVTALSRENRLKSTPQEERLWIKLSGKKLDGHKFGRHFPISRYIVDFYNHPNRLVIEIDGKIHENQQEYDANRDSWISASGYTDPALKIRLSAPHYRLFCYALSGVVIFLYSFSQRDCSRVRDERYTALSALRNIIL